MPSHRLVNVAPLRWLQLRQVVSAPAELLSARFETSDLATAIVQCTATAEESTRDAGVLPLLSYLLDDMWTQMVHRDDGVLRPPAQMKQLGGLLTERANSFLSHRPQSEQALRRMMTHKLAIMREDGQPIRRRASRSEFSEEEWRLVSELADRPNRLLVTATTEGGEAYAEVAHEALFRHWTKLSDWIADERKFRAGRTARSGATKAQDLRAKAATDDQTSHDLSIAELAARRNAAAVKSTPMRLGRDSGGTGYWWQPIVSSIAESEPPTDIVDASVFAPQNAQSGSKFLVQIFLHRKEESATAETLALAADSQTSARDIETLTTKIKRGQTVDVELEAEDLHIDHPKKSLRWEGEALACHFIVTVLSEPNARVVITARISIDGLPIGELSFVLGVVAAGIPAGIADLTGQARRYQYAFLSYSSRDRWRVMPCTQILQAAEISFFQDWPRLHGGDDWKSRLMEEIKRCDLFLLFWSSRAERSRWVAEEAKQALRRRKLSKNNTPVFRPVFLEGGLPRRPAWLDEEIHFDDALRYAIPKPGIVQGLVDLLVGHWDFIRESARARREHARS